MSGCPFFPANADPAAAPSTAGAATAVPATPPSAPAMPHSLLGFQTSELAFLHGAKPDPTHYGSYLGIEQLLNLQEGPAGCKPGGRGLQHHEELTFIVVHQVFELWFKLVLADLRNARALLSGLEADPTNNAVLSNAVVHCSTYLRRAETIFQHAVGAFGVMETMHPGDFLEFRDFLVPASGFQSVAFRSLEQLLGVQNVARATVNGQPVFAALQPEEQTKLAAERTEPSINDVVVKLLAKVLVPAEFLAHYVATVRSVLEEQQFVIAQASRDDPKAKSLIERGVRDVIAALDSPVEASTGLLISPEDTAATAEYRRAVIGALFIISYRFDPRFSALAALLDSLIAVEEGLLLWRGRHLHMAERMIGRRGGTGGTESGVGYLDMTRKYRIFHALWLVRRLLVRSSKLPPLDSYPDVRTANSVFA